MGWKKRDRAQGPGVCRDIVSLTGHDQTYQDGVRVRGRDIVTLLPAP